MRPFKSRSGSSLSSFGMGRLMSSKIKDISSKAIVVVIIISTVIAIVMAKNSAIFIVIIITINISIVVEIGAVTVIMIDCNT